MEESYGRNINQSRNTEGVFKKQSNKGTMEEKKRWKYYKKANGIRRKQRNTKRRRE